MLNRKELQSAIAECENAPANYQNCEKLATLYTLYDHLYAERQQAETIRETIVDVIGDTEFLQAVNGKEAQEVFELMNELIETIRILQPKLYNSVMNRLRNDIM